MMIGNMKLKVAMLHFSFLLILIHSSIIIIVIIIKFFKVGVYTLFSKNFHMNDGFSSDRHLYKFEALIFADSLCELFVHLLL